MFKLRLQFFLVLLLMSSLLTTGLYIFIKVSFQHDFWNYINAREIRFVQPLTNDIVKNYAQHKNWQWITTDWDQYVVSHLDFSEPPRPSKNDAESFPPPQNNPPEAEQRSNSPEMLSDDKDISSRREERERRDRRDFSRRMGATIFLLDEHHELIAGKNERRKDVFLIPLKNEDHIIGYLGMPVNPALRDLQDADFAHLQETKLALVIIIALIIAGVIAFPLAHFITKRIKQLVTQVEYLSQGKYQERITIKGKDELSLLAEHLNNLSETLSQSEQTRRQWVADISHELRTPLAVLQAELEAMEDGVRPLDTTAINRLNKHCQRLKHLVNDLYELSLTDLGGMTYRKNTLNLSTLVHEAVSTMQAQFAQQNIQLSLTNTEYAPITFFGDQNRLQQLLANLLKNSLQYTSSPGKTQVSLKTENNNAIIVVEDSAPGVDEAHHEKLFDRLYRADSSRNRATGGAGLGLSICKNIVAAHDGQIIINNSDLGGLKITIRLPL